MIYPKDTVVRETFRTFTDPAEQTSGDPTGVTVDYADPVGTPLNAAWPGGDVVRDSEGVFHLDITGTPGTYAGHWQATGAITTARDFTFTIAPAPFYLDVTGLRAVLSGTGNTAGTAATLTDDDLSEALWEAQAEVDARLAARYQTPFAQPPLLVISMVRDLAVYSATLTYRRSAPIPPGDPVLLRYQKAQALLTQAAKGTLSLPSPPPAAAGTQEADSGSGAVVNPWNGDLWTPADFDLTTGPRWPQMWP